VLAEHGGTQSGQASGLGVDLVALGPAAIHGEDVHVDPVLGGLALGENSKIGLREAGCSAACSCLPAAHRERCC
jgi:hypothetical protein